MHTFYLVLFIHWIGDFVCQSRWMAENKATKLIPMLVHIAVYGFILWFLLTPSLIHPPLKVFEFALINAGLHYITDSITSKCTKYFHETNQISAFFIIIGFDQMVHIMCLYSTMHLLG